MIQVAGLENIASNTLSACRTLSVDLVGREGTQVYSFYLFISDIEYFKATLRIYRFVLFKSMV